MEIGTTLSPVEGVKAASSFLRGSLPDELANESDQFSKPAVGVLKFHGIYQQDDRDARKSGAKRYSAMVRVGIPGGILTANQYLALDRIAGEFADGSLRITARQDIQFHSVSKHDLQTLIRTLDANLLATFAACGDVVRNVVCCPAPIASAERGELTPYVQLLSRSLRPRTHAYYEVWLDGEKAASRETLPDADPWEVEPLYGATYLPRKFKISFAFPGDNTTDVYANDIGIVAHYDDGRLAGFTILAGGGMGQSAGVKASHPRIADPICFVGADPRELIEAVTAMVAIHRDFGNRSNRKLARLKYVLDAWGVPRFREEVETRLGRKLAPPRPLTWRRADDYLGWHPQQATGASSPLWFFGVRVMAGRVKDFSPQSRIRSGLRAIVEEFQCGVSLTAQQNLYLTGIAGHDRLRVAALLREFGIVEPKALPPILRHAMACPALPTCGLALTESERILPEVAAEIQAEFNSNGLPDQVVHLRTTGCPNGCARPYTAEIGIVGASVALYTIYLGGSPVGTRLGSVFAENVKRTDVATRLRPVIEYYARSRHLRESFGDFCYRVGVAKLRDECIAGKGPASAGVSHEIEVVA
jgi:sulfite reductase (ferredoxin)